MKPATPPTTLPREPGPCPWTGPLARAIELVETERARHGGHDHCTFEHAVRILMRKAEAMVVEQHLAGRRLPGPVRGLKTRPAKGERSMSKRPSATSSQDR